MKAVHSPLISIPNLEVEVEEERTWVAKRMKNNPLVEERMSLVGEDLLSHPTLKPPAEAEAKTLKMVAISSFSVVEETYLKKNPAFPPNLTLISFC